MPWLTECVDPFDYVHQLYTKTITESDILPGQSPTEVRMKQMVNLNFRWFMQTLLDRKDRMSMYHGLEVRVPFCDYRIAEYLYGVPWAFKDFRGREKGLLRHAMEGLLPEPVLYRKKSPYPKTFDPRYEALVRGELESLLARDAALWSVVSKASAKQLLDAELTTPWYGQLMRKPQLMGYLLQIHHWLETYQVQLLF
jgi:asparagine synthase (glutamine-hydrolysing)